MFVRQDFKGGNGGPTALSSSGSYIAVIANQTSILLYRDLDNLLQPCARYTKPPSIDCGWSNQITWAEDLGAGDLDNPDSDGTARKSDLIFAVVSLSRTHVCLFGSSKAAPEPEPLLNALSKKKQDAPVLLVGDRMDASFQQTRISELPTESTVIRKLSPSLLLSFPLEVSAAYPISTVHPRIILLFSHSPTVALMTEGQSQISSFLHLPLLRVCESNAVNTLASLRVPRRGGSYTRRIEKPDGRAMGYGSVSLRRPCDGTNCDKSTCTGLRLLDILAKGQAPQINSPLFANPLTTNLGNSEDNKSGNSLLQILKVRQPKTSANDREDLARAFGQKGVAWSALDAKRNWLYVLLATGTLLGLSLSLSPNRRPYRKSVYTGARPFSFLRSKDDATKASRDFVRSPKAPYDSRMVGRVLGFENMTKLLNISYVKDSCEILVLRRYDADASVECFSYDLNNWWENGCEVSQLFRHNGDSGMEVGSNDLSVTDQAQVINVSTPVNDKTSTPPFSSPRLNEDAPDGYEVENLNKDNSSSPRNTPQSVMSGVSPAVRIKLNSDLHEQDVETRSFSAAWTSDGGQLVIAVRTGNQTRVSCLTRHGDALSTRYVHEAESQGLHYEHIPLLWNRTGDRLLVGFRECVRLYEIVMPASINMRSLFPLESGIVAKGITSAFEFSPNLGKLIAIPKPSRNSCRTMYSSRKYYLADDVDRCLLLGVKCHGSEVLWYRFPSIRHDGQFGWLTDNTCYVVQEFQLPNVSARFYALTLYQIDSPRSSTTPSVLMEATSSSAPEALAPTVRFKGQASPSLNKPSLITILTDDKRWARSDFHTFSHSQCHFSEPYTETTILESMRQKIPNEAIRDQSPSTNGKLLESALNDLENVTPSRGNPLVTRHRSGSPLTFDYPAIAIYFEEQETLVCYRITAGPPVRPSTQPSKGSDLHFDCLYVARCPTKLRYISFVCDIFSFVAVPAGQATSLCLGAIVVDRENNCHRRPSVYGPSMLVLSSSILTDVRQVLAISDSKPIATGISRLTGELSVRLSGPPGNNEQPISRISRCDSPLARKASHLRSASTDSPLAHRRLEIHDESADDQSEAGGWNMVLVGGDELESSEDHSSATSSFTDYRDQENDDDNEALSDVHDEEESNIIFDLKQKVRESLEGRVHPRGDAFIGGSGFMIRTSDQVIHLEVCMNLKVGKGSQSTLKYSAHQHAILNRVPPCSLLLHADGEKDLLVLLLLSDTTSPSIRMIRFQAIAMKESICDSSFVDSEGGLHRAGLLSSVPKITVFDLMFYLTLDVIRAIRRAAGRHSSPLSRKIASPSSSFDLMSSGILNINLIQRALLASAHESCVANLFSLLDTLMIPRWPLDTIRHAVRISRVHDPLVTPFVLFPICQTTLAQAFQTLLLNHDMQTATAMLIPLQQIYGPEYTRIGFACKILMEAILQSEPFILTDVDKFINAAGGGDPDRLKAAVDNTVAEAVEILLQERKIRALALAMTTLQLKLDSLFLRLSPVCRNAMQAADDAVIAEWVEAIRRQFYVVDRPIPLFGKFENGPGELVLSDWVLLVLGSAASRAQFTVIERAVIIACGGG